MGWNTSLIIIENKENFSNENELLELFGFINYEQIESTTFDEILNPKNNQIGIGYYNGNIIICDGYKLTTKAIEEAKNLNLAAYEKKLVNQFPTAEIVTVSCVSSVNFHGYSLIQNGEKKRLKYVAEDTKQEFGKRFEEEIEIYQNAYEENGKLYWKEDEDEDEVYFEDQLMEDFTFKIAKRRLGVQIDTEEADDLFEKTTFHVYQPAHQKKSINQPTKTTDFKWKKYILIAAILIVIKIVFKLLKE